MAKGDEFECYVIECMACGNRRFVNKKNNLMSLFSSGCNQCYSKKSRWELIGEGKFETKQVNIPNKINRDTEDYIFSNLRKW